MVCSRQHVFLVVQNQKAGNIERSQRQSLLIYAPVEASFAQITFEKLQQIDLADTVYSAVSLSKRNGVTFKSGALLIGADAIYRVDDSEQTVQQLITVQQIMEQNEKE